MNFLAELGGLGSAVLMVAKAAAPALVAGAVIKHGKKIPGLGLAMRRIPNGLIPAILPIVGAAVTGDPVIGAAGGVGATWVHQLVKVGVRTALERAAPVSRLHAAVGPGARLSI